MKLRELLEEHGLEPDELLDYDLPDARPMPAVQHTKNGTLTVGASILDGGDYLELAVGYRDYRGS